MKKIMLMAMFALATVTAAVAQDKKDMKSPEARMARQEKMMTKLNFTDQQRAQVKVLNEKYAGANFDRKQYHAEFRTILTDEQKQRADAMRAEHKANREKKGKKMQAR